MGDDPAHGQPYISLKPLHMEPGLYVTATPVGNLGDITIRALQVLAGADRIACEDSRMTARLLARYGIETPLILYHEHNAPKQRPQLLGFLASGERIALVSDAGTPLISDPGYSLVADAVEAGHRVFPVPGPSAALAALSASGLPTDAFHFAGFLPPKEKGRKDRLEALKDVPATLILYESANRLEALCRSVTDVMGPGTPVVLARELTKRYEEFRRMPVRDLVLSLEERAPKGECVLLIDPRSAQPEAVSEDELDDLIRARAGEGLPAKALSADIASATGLKKRDVYQRILALRDE